MAKWLSDLQSKGNFITCSLILFTFLLIQIQCSKLSLKDHRCYYLPRSSYFYFTRKKTCIVKITKLSCLSLAASKLRLRIFYKIMSVLEHYVFLYFPKTLPIFFCPLIFLSSSFCFFLGCNCKYAEFARIQKNFQGAKNNLQGFFFFSNFQI